MALYALDVETHLVQPGLLAPPLVCLSWAHDDDFGLLDRHTAAIFVRRLLVEEHTLVLHNGVYDLAVLANHDPDLMPLIFEAYAAGRIFDTKIREELKDIAAGRRQDGSGIFVFHGGEARRADYSLAGLAKRYLQKDRSAAKSDPDAWRFKYASLEDVPLDQWPAAASDYAIEDSVDTLAVFEAQGGLEGVMPTEVVQNQAAWALHLQSCWGFRTDPVATAQLEAELLTQQAKNQAVLKKVKFLVPEKCSAKEVEEGKAAFYVTVEKTKKVTKKFMRENFHQHTYREDADGKISIVMKVEVPYRWKKDTAAIEAYVQRVYRRRGMEAPLTESGRVATDKDTCYESGSRLLKLMADGGGVDKILGTYIPVLKQGTAVPINVRYNVLVNSGRTSAKEPNIQNLPNGRRIGGVRECFIPRAGYVFSSVDYSTLELCALAQVCLVTVGYSKMAEAINAGRDLHAEMGAALTGMTYEEVMAEKDIKGSRAKQARDLSKALNFGFPGGLGAQSFVDFARASYGQRLEVSEAQKLKQMWLQQWPEMRAYFSWVNDHVGHGEAQLVHPITGYIRGGVGYCDGANNGFQHLAATGAKMALFRVAWESYVDLGTALYGSRPVGFIHDEIIAEHPAEAASEAVERMTKVMEQEMSKVIRDVTIGAEPTLMARWYKNAKLVRDATGRVIPWEPKKK